MFDSPDGPLKRPPLVMVCFFLLFTFTAVRAQEILVWDEEGTEKSKPGKYNKGFPLRPGLPTNWTRPINYGRGRLYVRFEILNCPTNRSGALQFCFVQGTNKLMIHNKFVRYSGTGLTADDDFPSALTVVNSGR